jgi:hypothetical protein
MGIVVLFSKIVKNFFSMVVKTFFFLHICSLSVTPTLCLKFVLFLSHLHFASDLFSFCHIYTLPHICSLSVTSTLSGQRAFSLWTPLCGIQ